MKKITVFALFLLMVSGGVYAGNVRFIFKKTKTDTCFVLENAKVRQSVVIRHGKLFSDTLQLQKAYAAAFHRPVARLISDANFSVRVVWTGLRAPGMNNNAENPVQFDRSDFVFSRYAVTDSLGGKQLFLFFKGKNNPFTLCVTYSLLPEKFYARRSLAVNDPKLHGHFLDRMDPRKGNFLFTTGNKNKTSKVSIGVEGMGFANAEEVTLKKTSGSGIRFLKKGGFGQPVAFASQNDGGFIGLEYPAGTSEVRFSGKSTFFVDSYQYFGERIENQPIRSNTVVTAVTPQPYVKNWFFDYVNDIRVAPAKPYILYNSWYDLRSEAYAKVDKKIPPDAVMNEKNTLRIIHLLQKNMIQKYHIHLNAVVLDDGWDNYESAWSLNKNEFPHGLRPLADTLAKTHTRLGIWYGPMGGYSFAMRRVKWMGEHGYEVTGHKYVYGSAKLCLAGKNYSRLFQQRVTSMVRNDHVGYFKWDGIQFSCSNPTHGHPVGIYSRRAVLQSVIAKCKAVRAIDSSVYLNITTGTWLSPWWLQYANQIWMDAADYAFSDVPSVSRRDNAMTYRDYALYDDFKVRNMWIPMANLMTHGIIKGRLENISKGGEPLDRFTNNVVLYFARGISMWELYISPDILTTAEWEVLSQAIKWAESVQHVMPVTYMTGGNPAKGEVYGYLHFQGDKGLIAVRNPKVEQDTIRIILKPDYGLNENAASLVVEQVYPYRRILPDLYSAGGRLSIPLNGFETAIFNVYPLQSSNRPLLADAVFSLQQEGNQLFYKVYQTGPRSRFLQPQKIATIKRTGGENKSFTQLDYQQLSARIKSDYLFSVKKGKKTVAFQVVPKKEKTVTPHEVALLLTHPAPNSDFPEVTARQNGKVLPVKKQMIKGKWAWYSVIPNGSDEITITVNRADWHGKAQLWIDNITVNKPLTLEVVTTHPLPKAILPPLPFPENESRHYILMKKLDL
ncbi:alpha-galactosidase [Candidatus Sulfidibacterium hydrothermale]|uniref:alpha-galactosidase n=1 Tax=Candidatus Sulfidibacterium hydrothermale TaxID=2875962 RepID=UPI001F0A442A|nr:alpha-galactosidase [Candidatus Sulfidibacterium hydrothermale]UBM63438.1 alpha-galactosidase [Candidatus Sulfidibacterium hydrothermale]